MANYLLSVWFLILNIIWNDAINEKIMFFIKTKYTKMN